MKSAQKSSFGIKEIGQLVQQLKAENNPANNELIAFYEKRVNDAISQAYAKALKQVAKAS